MSRLACILILSFITGNLSSATALFRIDGEEAIKFTELDTDVIKQKATLIWKNNKALVKRLMIRGKAIEVYRWENALYAIDPDVPNRFDYSGPVRLKDREIIVDAEIN